MPSEERTIKLDDRDEKRISQASANFLLAQKQLHDLQNLLLPSYFEKEDLLKNITVKTMNLNEGEIVVSIE